MAAEDNPGIYRNSSKGIIMATIIAIAIIAGAYLISKSAPNIYLTSDNAQQLNKISVSGTASDKLTPDLLKVSLRVQTEANDAKTSQSQNSVLSSDLKNRLKILGIADKNVKTVSYQVTPVYKSKPCDPSGIKCYGYESYISGYQATETIGVDLTDIKMGGIVIDTATGVGVNQTFVDEISFTLQEQTRRDLESALLKKAAAASKLKAQNIADGLGVSLGKAVMGSETSNFNYVPLNYAYAGMAATKDSVAQTQLSSGEIEVSATVNTQYQIQ